MLFYYTLFMLIIQWKAEKNKRKRRVLFTKLSPTLSIQAMVGVTTDRIRMFVNIEYLIISSFSLYFFKIKSAGNECRQIQLDILDSHFC